MELEGAWILAETFDALFAGVAARLAPRGPAAVIPPAPASDPLPDGRLPLAAFVAKLEAMRDGAHDPTAPWRAGMEFDLARLGPLGAALAEAPCFGDALRALALGFPTLQTATSAEMRIEAGEVRFSYRILDRAIWPRRADSELTLGLIQGIAARYGVGPDAIREIGFEHAPDRDGRALSALARCETSHGRIENVIAFAPGALSQRLQAREGRGAVYRDGLARLEKALGAQRAGFSLSARVREAILAGTGHAAPGAEEIAARLGLSERSLRRKLASEETSFQQLREECLLDEAAALLLRTSRPISEIAILLGYSDQTAFTRAFSRAAGCSPRALRKAGESAIR